MKTEKPTREERLKAYEYARDWLNDKMDNQVGICQLLRIQTKADKIEVENFPEFVEMKPKDKDIDSYWFNSAKERIQVLTKIINKMKEENRINVKLPSDCEAKFDKENNVLIISKKEEGVYIPNSVSQIEDRKVYGTVIENSSQETLHALYTLSQLVEMRDASNGDWRADWSGREVKHTIEIIKGEPKVDQAVYLSTPLAFKSEEIAIAFLKKHRELILTAKELL